MILILLWLLYNFTEYYYLPYIVKPFSWLLVCITLLILLFKQVNKVTKEWKNLKKNRLLNLSLTLFLFFLTFFNFNKIPHSIIEKIDWTFSFNERLQIVKEVLTEKLKPETERNNGICKLPFDFPLISNGGNEIWIYENKIESTKTIKFWISRGFFESPQTYFIFTNDNDVIKHYEEKIIAEPEYNWKLEENWYRIMEKD